MNYWTQEQLDGRFTVDQIRFMDFKEVGTDLYLVTNSAGKEIPPPRPETLNEAFIRGGVIGLVAGTILGLGAGLGIWCLIDWLKTL